MQRYRVPFDLTRHVSFHPAKFPRTASITAVRYWSHTVDLVLRFISVRSHAGRTGILPPMTAARDRLPTLPQSQSGTNGPGRRRCDAVHFGLGRRR